MAWYALAYTRVHELYHLQGFLRVAKEIFHWCWNKGWDHSSDCGGIWFDQSHQGKSTIENTQMYALGMKLARFSNSPQEKQDFQGKSEKVWNFLTNKTGILNGTTFQVFFLTPRCLKITEKVSFNIASEASYVYILSGQKLIKNSKNGPFWRVFENLLA